MKMNVNVSYLASRNIRHIKIQWREEASWEISGHWLTTTKPSSKTSSRIKKESRSKQIISSSTSIGEKEVVAN